MSAIKQIRLLIDNLRIAWQLRKRDKALLRQLEEISKAAPAVNKETLKEMTAFARTLLDHKRHLLSSKVGASDHEHQQLVSALRNALPASDSSSADRFIEEVLAIRDEVANDPDLANVLWRSDEEYVTKIFPSQLSYLIFNLKKKVIC